MSTILLVDDDAGILEVYSAILELMGHDVVLAEDGVQALERARQRRPDLVVTDLMMPRMDGVALCQALTRAPELQGIPILMHSSSPDPHAPGVLAFLPKCGDLERFEDAVTRALAHRPARRASASRSPRLDSRSSSHSQSGLSWRHASGV